MRDLPSGFAPGRRIAYHLSNGQNVRRQPRDLFRAIPVVDLCCGSAGTYNLDQPEIAASPAGQKAKAVIATGAEVVATGKIGCLTQMRMHLEKIGSSVRVQHTIQVLRDAYSEIGRQR